MFYKSLSYVNSCCLSLDRCKASHPGQLVYNQSRSVSSFCLRKPGDPIHLRVIPTVVGDFNWLKQAIWLFVGRLVSLTHMAVFQTLLNVNGHSGRPMKALHIVLCSVDSNMSTTI